MLRLQKKRLFIYNIETIFFEQSFLKSPEKKQKRTTPVHFATQRGRISSKVAHKRLVKKAENVRHSGNTPSADYWFDVSKAESKAILLVGKSNDFTRAHASVAPCTLSILPSSHSTDSGPL